MQPPQASRVPQVCDALVAMMSAQLSGCDILDGPSVQANVNTDYVAVGAPGVASSMQQLPKLGTPTYIETAQVSCTAGSWDGSTVTKPRRDRCGQILDVIRQALPTLSLPGLCDEAVMGQRLGWTQQQTSNGAFVFVAFTITVKTVI